MGVSNRGSGGGVSDHSLLTNLTAGDPHTQYARLLGRAGGQTIISGTGSGENLILGTTSHSTKGIAYIDSTSSGHAFGGANVGGVGAQIYGGTTAQNTEATALLLRHRGNGSFNCDLALEFAPAQGIGAYAGVGTGYTKLVAKVASGVHASMLVVNKIGGTYTVHTTFDRDGNLALGAATPSYGGGKGVFFIAIATVEPTTNPTGGGILYFDSTGALKCRAPSGVVTELAPG